MIGNSRFDRVRISKHGGSKRNFKSIENSTQNTKSGQALAAPVQCPEIARVHFLASGYIGTDRNSATVGGIFQEHFWPVFLLFEWLHLKLEIFFLDLKSTENSYNNQNPPYWIPCSCL